jgi:hypothetical protein
MSRPVLILIFIGLCANVSIAQLPRSSEDLLGNGISVRVGLGHLALRDNYISDEKYSGSFPSFGIFWLRGDTSFAHRLGLDYAASSDIRNNNVSTQVMQTGLNLDFLNSVGKFQVLSHDVAAYIGPSAEFYVHYRQQNIARGGNAGFNAYSFALYISLSANSTLVIPLSPDFSAETSARLALLSAAGRLADMHDNKAKFFKLVTVFSGLRGYTEFLVRYNLSERFLLKAGYRFEICQSSSWDYLLSASDNLVLIATVRL